MVLQGDIQDRTRGGAQRLRRLRQAPLADIAAECVAGGAAEHALQVPFGVARLGGDVIQQQRLVQMSFNPV